MCFTAALTDEYPLLTEALEIPHTDPVDISDM